MTHTLPPQSDRQHLERLESLPLRQAKATLNKSESWSLVGQAIGRTFALEGLTQKEGAALIGRDAAQVARWIAGDERPQVEAVFAVPRLRPPLVVALAGLAGTAVEVETTIRVRGAA